jgi:hypothetical protein
MAFRMLQQPDYQQDGLEIVSFGYLQDSAFCNTVADIYKTFNPAKNAKNELCRAVRWGMLLNDEFSFSRKNTYQLDANLNPLEAGRIRVMDIIPDELVQSVQIQSFIRDVFRLYYPDRSSFDDAYIIQMSAIRYQPTPEKACYPSPDMPHQDGFNNGIVVLNVTPNLVGGNTRVYDLDGNICYEAKLKAGQAVFVQDNRWKHQVEPMLIDTQVSEPDTPAYRDILIVRIDPAKR